MSPDADAEGPGSGRAAAAETAAIVRWLSTNVGGTVTSITRQHRWRPVWFVELDRGGDAVELCVRGARSDVELVFPLEHEMRFQATLRPSTGRPPRRRSGAGVS